MKRSSKSPTKNEKLLQGAALRAAEARCLVENYYASQDMRKAADMQLRHLGARDELPLLTAMADHFAQAESELVGPMRAYVLADPSGRWMLEQTGVGPIIAAGLLAHIDIEQAPPAGV